MARKQHFVEQGTEEWLRLRRQPNHFWASEAAAMLGIDPHTSRDELLRMKSTGVGKEFSDFVQREILDKGHENEAAARSIAEDILGDDLSPAVFTAEFDAFTLGASLDGITLASNPQSEEIWENKSPNAALVRALNSNYVPDQYMPQLQQQLLVTGAKSVLFTASNGDPETTLVITVKPDPAWFQEILDGWAQFKKDLDAWKPVEIVEPPKAEAIMQLPALSVQIKGEVTLSNLPQFKAAADQFIANINTDLATDEDFANAEATVKFCKDAEDKLDLAKAAAISQTASIDELMRTIDHIQAQMRDKRLMLDKLVKQRKEQIKAEIIHAAKIAFSEHVYALNAEVKPVEIMLSTPDFAGAIKNKRTLASLHDAVNTTLANAKIEADAKARDIREKLATFNVLATEHRFLFSDLQQLIEKPASDFRLQVETRIARHNEAEAAKIEAKRKQMEAEAEAKAKAEAQAEIERQVAEQLKIEAQGIRNGRALREYANSHWAAIEVQAWAENAEFDEAKTAITTVDAIPSITLSPLEKIAAKYQLFDWQMKALDDAWELGYAARDDELKGSIAA